MNLNPSQLEGLINHHFSVLFDHNDAVTLSGHGLEETWLRCALTEKGKALLIETDSVDSPFTRQAHIASRVYTGRIRMEEIERGIDNQQKHFVAFYCRNERLIQLFSRLMADIIWHLCDEGPQSGDPWIYLLKRLEGWKLLFSGSDNIAIEKGLIGELYILRHLIARYSFPVTVWEGPMNGVKDFRLPGQNVEVKTTSSRYGYFVELSGLYQTSILQAQERMVFIRLEQTGNGLLSVQSLVAELTRLITSPDEINEFRRKLEDYPREIFETSNKWEVLESVVMAIDENFPRISEQSFVDHRLPNGVIQIKWTADLIGLEKTMLSEFNF